MFLMMMHEAEFNSFSVGFLLAIRSSIILKAHMKIVAKLMRKSYFYAFFF